MDKVIWYSSSDYEDPERHMLKLPRTYDIARPVEERAIATECAADFHNNHDGWECRWPRDITLYETEDGPPLASFEVDREMVPEFWATKKAVAA